ncbi:MAG: hypothetical protein RJA69_931 [Pseudomonadota bacterium]|jgi:hypothetical protein
MSAIRSPYVSALLTVAACGAAYAWLFLLNHLLFEHLEFVRGVNWVFLPSGLRMTLVLIFVEWGALGIAGASMAIAYFGFGMSALDALVTGGISGLAPWLARRLCMHGLGMDPDIQHLHPKQLIQLSLIFSITSPVLHQLWYSWNGWSTHFAQDTLVMIVGDLLGTLIVLSGLRLFVLWLRARRPHA